MTVQDAPNPIVHRVTMKQADETRKAKTRLDEVLEEKEMRAAQRFSAAELDKMALESENEARRLRGEPLMVGGKTVATDEEKKKEDEIKLAEQREKLTIQAKALIDSGMPAQQVGQMLMGLPTAGGGAAAIPVQQGMGFKEVMELMTFMVGKKESDELKSTITALSKQVEDLAKGGGRKTDITPVDPVAFATQQAEAVSAWHTALEKIAPKPASTHTSDSIEVVKEKNRHDEEMEKIRDDRDYKRSITDIASDIPERIGRGYANQVRDDGGADKSGNGGGLESIICSEDGCHTKIFITPQTGNSVTCPKCKTIYNKDVAAVNEA